MNKTKSRKPSAKELARFNHYCSVTKKLRTEMPDDKEFAPRIVANDKDGKLHILFADFIDGKSKDMFASTSRAYMACHEVTDYAFISEAWIKVFNEAGIKESEIPEGPVSRMEGREECMIVSYESNDGVALVSTMKINKDTDGKLISIEDPSEPFEGADGRFVGLLPPRGMHIPDDKKELILATISPFLKALEVKE